FWYQLTAVDWAARAEAFATRADGSVDAALASAYRARFAPGVETEPASGLVAPFLFWPCALEVADALPSGVEAEVLWRSSPASFAWTPAPSVHPLGGEPLRAPGRDLRRAYNDFAGPIYRILQSEEPRQY